ncbi:hypothetical protein [Kitasatospora sp. NPDC056531]|uniref:hypothetical protein n=1 Tax=Kitasatospora sp. NPDC056531 TaxID=3345856 RepID=UPI0036B480BF
MSTTSLAVPDPDDGDQGADHPTDRLAKASPGRDKGPGATSTDTSAGTSVPPTTDQPVSAGQRPRSRGLGRGDNPLPPAAEVRWKRGSTEPVRNGVLVSLGLFQRATGRELWPLVLPRQRNDKATRDAIGDLEDAGRVRQELRLPDNRKLWCLTAAGRREAAGLLPAGAKLSALRPERDGPGTAFWPADRGGLPAVRRRHRGLRHPWVARLVGVHALAGQAPTRSPTPPCLSVCLLRREGALS